MKIAVPYENGQIFQHFGHTERFKVYTATAAADTSATEIKAAPAPQTAQVRLSL